MRGNKPLGITALFVTALLAGCLSGESESGLSALERGQAHVDETFGDSYFFGMVAFDGEHDLGTLADMFGGGDEMQDKLESKFSAAPDGGEPGDGLAGAWYTFHLIGDFDGDGGAFILSQVVAGGDVRSLVDPFETEVSESVETSAAFGPRVSLPTRTLQDIDTSECAEYQDSWNIDSQAAARTAREHDLFATYVEEHPGLDYVYLLEPADCDDDDAYWSIMYTDLSAIDDGDFPESVHVDVDATTGEVVDAGIDVPLDFQMLYDGEEFGFAGPLIPTLGIAPAVEARIPLPVADDAKYLFVFAWSGDRSVGPSLGRSEISLEAPDGSRQSSYDDFWGFMEADVEDPMPGTWHLVFEFDTVLPLEQHSLEVTAGVAVPSE